MTRRCPYALPIPDIHRQLARAVLRATPRNKGR